MPDTHTKRPRASRTLKNFLVNSKLQLKYVLGVTLLSAVIAVALGVLIYQQSTFASDQIIAALDAPGTEWLDSQIKGQVKAQLSSSDVDLILTMAGVGLGLAVVLIVSLLVLTHSVAGPLHRMSNYFDALRGGWVPHIGGVRRGDQFHDLFDALRVTIDGIRQNTEAEIDEIRALIDAIDNAPGERPSATHRARKALEELEALKKGSLKGG